MRHLRHCFAVFMLAVMAVILNGCNNDNEVSDGGCANGHCPVPSDSGGGTCASGHCQAHHHHHTGQTTSDGWVVVSETTTTTQIPVTIHSTDPAPATGTVAIPVPEPVAPPIATQGDNVPAPVTAPPAGAGKVYCVYLGINEFLDPGAPPLTGCVPDAGRLYSKSTGNAKPFAGICNCNPNWAQHNWGIDPKNVTLLLNKEATVAHLKAALNDAVAKAQPGDDIIYWQSSHGTEDTIPDDNGKDVHGMVCCYDFGWDREHEMCDVDFRAIFSKAKPGVAIWWGADSCNSGNLDRNVGKHKHPIRAKAVIQPANVRIRVHSARVNGAKTKGIADELPVGFLPGCKPDQTSADSEDDEGYPGGALTIMFMKEIDDAATLPLTTLGKKINADLAADGYDQICVPSGKFSRSPWMHDQP